MIKLTDKSGTEKCYPTDSYLLLYFEGENLKATGDIKMQDIAPLLLKLVAKKFGG